MTHCLTYTILYYNINPYHTRVWRRVIEPGGGGGAIRAPPPQISATQEPIDLKLGTDIKQVEKNKNQKEK